MQRAEWDIGKEFEGEPLSLEEWFRRRGVVVGGLPELVAPEGVGVEVIKRRVEESLRGRGKSEVFEQLVEAAEYATKEFENYEGGKKLWRKSGDHVMTHPWWMVHLLTEVGVSDGQVLVAAMLHDVPEDTTSGEGVGVKNKLTEIESRYGSGVAGLVNAMTKIKSRRVTAEQVAVDMDDLNYQVGVPFPEEEAHLATLDKIYGVDDPRAWLLKIADNAHNMLTLGSLSPRAKQKEKARIGRVYYAPLARQLGLTQVADLIDIGAVLSLYSGRSKKISETLEIVKGQFGDGMDQAINRWRAQEVGFGIGRWRMPNIAQVFDRTIGIEEVGTEACVPEIELQFDDVESRWLGYGKLCRLLGRFEQDNEIDFDPFGVDIEDDLIVYKKAWLVKVEEGELVVPISLSVRGLELVHMFDDEPVEPRWQDSIGQRLQSMQDEYRRRVKHGLEVSIRQAVELNREGRMVVFGNDGQPRQIMTGATALDFAHDIHENLGLAAVQVLVFRGERVLRGLGTILQPGDGVKVFTESSLLKAESVDRDRVWIDDFDWAVTVKTQEETRKYLEQMGVFDSVEGKRALDERGNRIIEWLYSLRVGRRMWVSQQRGMDEELVKVHGSLANLRQKIGRIQRPQGRSEFARFWEGEGRMSSRLLEDLDRLVENLSRFEQSRWRIEISIKDERGVLASLGEFLESSGASAQNFDTWADNSDPEVNYSYIGFSIQEGGRDEAEVVVERLKDRYGGKLRHVMVIEPELKEESGGEW